MQAPAEPNQIKKAEISLLDIVQFGIGAWKKLAIAAFIGAILGFGAWTLFGSYSAEYVLFNNASTNSNSNSNTTYALDLVYWKMIQKSLPNLAAQIIDEGVIPGDQVSLYKSLQNDQWWQKNIIPSYALSKLPTFFD
ncbi:hypothetical protein SAMN06295945_1466 [Polynucleobacter meluiroseus]|uniref:Uncharacterized protein n=1 Tax=Polynucleobacter meluiroseus TaxID=1938814 RepID=A0A240E1L7_9BURK|nr:hypothetical protein [Polynucleobacter meluiroseus]SNX29102.1 hypothetical protein SAMN06295945_1466 [Polynucleobacter meluiroseus]